MFTASKTSFSLFKSKVSFNPALTSILGQILLPEKRYCTMDFLKALLSGKKSIMKNQDVHPINVPRYKKMSLKCILNYINTKPTIKKFIPDGINPEDPGIDRSFIFTMLNTCEPAYFPTQLAQIEQERLLVGQRQ